MDIIDVILGRAMSPGGSIERYAKRAEEAVRNANTAIDNIATITAQTNSNNEASEQALERARQAMEDLENTLADARDGLAYIDDARIGTVDARIDELYLSKNLVTQSNNDVFTNLTTNFPDGTTKTLEQLVKYYSTKGQNTDGTMTQLAISTELDNLATRIENININFGAENEGIMLVVGSDGNMRISALKEKDIIDYMKNNAGYKNAVGIETNYTDGSITRLFDATVYSAGENFNSYPMYGGRIKCNVNDDGAITAFYGDLNYVEDGSNGQVMVYQPKFYYKRMVDESANTANGTAITKERLVLSAVKQTGFKVHPLFINEEGEEVDYALIPAYEGIIEMENGSYDLNNNQPRNYSAVKLSSVAQGLPSTAFNSSDGVLTIQLSEKAATNRGAGWHATNMAYESLNQMLFSVEYAALNTQVALGAGNTKTGGPAITGSTAELGNTSGVINGHITYRGVENLWGNTWRFVNGIKIVNTANSLVVYVSKDFNYDYTNEVSNYNALNFTPSSSHGWISKFGYDANYDWLYLPIECSGASSLLPVGDSYWPATTGNPVSQFVAGGNYLSEDSGGLYYYACDQAMLASRNSYNACMMHIPLKNANYTANIALWKKHYEG